jgi:hypothetical protein
MTPKEGRSRDHQRHRDDHDRPSATGCVLAHQRPVAGEQGDEHEQRQEQHGVDRLGDEQIGTSGASGTSTTSAPTPTTSA